MARLLSLALLLWGCDDLSEFETEPGEVFRGPVVGSDQGTDGSDEGSFIRTGFPSFSEMALTFDPALAGLSEDPGSESALEAPGSVDTRYPCPDDSDDCEPGDMVSGPLVDAELERIPSLGHDALSLYDFPGGGRIRNYMFGARFQSGEGEEAVARNATVFISLMESRQIEVRVIAPSVREPSGEGDLYSALFGVFVLERDRQ